MGAKNRKTQKKVDLLEMSNIERVEVIEKLKQSLRQSISEARLWKTLLRYENVTINGHVVFSSDSPLEGLSVQLNPSKV
jgi:hypothetical protein